MDAIDAERGESINLEKGGQPEMQKTEVNMTPREHAQHIASMLQQLPMSL
jgi:hypothetical protein